MEKRKMDHQKKCFHLPLSFRTDRKKKYIWKIILGFFFRTIFSTFVEKKFYLFSWIQIQKNTNFYRKKMDPDFFFRLPLKLCLSKDGLLLSVFGSTFFFCQSFNPVFLCSVSQGHFDWSTLLTLTVRTQGTNQQKHRLSYSWHNCTSCSCWRQRGSSHSRPTWVRSKTADLKARTHCTFCAFTAAYRELRGGRTKKRIEEKRGVVVKVSSDELSSFLSSPQRQVELAMCTLPIMLPMFPTQRVWNVRKSSRWFTNQQHSTPVSSQLPGHWVISTHLKSCPY